MLPFAILFVHFALQSITSCILALAFFPTNDNDQDDDDDDDWTMTCGTVCMQLPRGAWRRRRRS